MKAIMLGVINKSFDANTTAAPLAGTVFAVPLKPNGTRTLAYQTYFGASNPSAISIGIEGSLDGTNWVALATLTTVTGDLGSVVFPYTFVRAYVNSRTGGTSVTVDLVVY